MSVWGAIGAAAGDLLGGALDRRSREQEASLNRHMQYEFAKKGIQWRVADAEAAGIHPLYAIGANVPTYTPVRGAGGLGRSIAAAGQNIGRAIEAHYSTEERAEVQRASDMARLQNDMLQNEYLSTRIALMRAGTGPGVSSRRTDVMRPPEVMKYETTGNIGGSPGGNLPFSGSKWSVTPDRLSAQTVEDLYSEVGSWPYGAMRLSEDFWLNQRKSGERFARKWFRKEQPHGRRAYAYGKVPRPRSKPSRWRRSGKTLWKEAIGHYRR